MKNHNKRVLKFSDHLFIECKCIGLVNINYQTFCQKNRFNIKFVQKTDPLIIIHFLDSAVAVYCKSIRL